MMAGLFEEGAFLITYFRMVTRESYYRTVYILEEDGGSNPELLGQWGDLRGKWLR